MVNPSKSQCKKAMEIMFNVCKQCTKSSVHFHSHVVEFEI